MIKKLLLVLITFSCAVRGMEQLDPILACICRASNVEQACENATDLLKKQTDRRKIITERFLLTCQQKFHRSMYEVGFNLSSSESLEIAANLAKEAKDLWLSRPNGGSFIGHLRNKKDLADKIPSYLYYIFGQSEYAEKAKNPFPEPNFIAGYLCGRQDDLCYWIDSGLFHTNRLRHFLEMKLNWCDDENITISFQQIINAGFDIINLRIEKLTAEPKSPDQFYLLLDYVIDRKIYLDSLGTNYKKNSWIAMQIVRMLIKAGAKSKCEL